MNRFAKIALVTTSLALFISCSYIKEVTSEDLPTITVDELASALQAGTVKVIDCNTEETYRKNHIPTAIHMRPTEAAASALPADKNSNLVFYCKNTMCMASHKGARIALKQGYSNVKVLPEGIDGWMKAGKTVESGGI